MNLSEKIFKFKEFEKSSLILACHIREELRYFEDKSEGVNVSIVREESSCVYEFTKKNKRLMIMLDEGEDGAKWSILRKKNVCLCQMPNSEIEKQGAPMESGNIRETSLFRVLESFFSDS